MIKLKQSPRLWSDDDPAPLESADALGLMRGIVIATLLSAIIWLLFAAIGLIAWRTL